MDRRDFLAASGMLLAGTASAYALPLLTACASGAGGAAESPGRRKWGMVIDLGKCAADCSACVEACRKENNVALHGDKRWDIYLIRKVRIRRKQPANSVERCVPLLCNHCDSPPCAQACPVQATYKRADGIVVVDHHRCIGCRYCMLACPYNARYFNYKENRQWPNKDYPKRSHGVPESCTFCAHLVDKGQQPACVEACKELGARALVFGDLNDPQSEVSRLIATSPVKGIREDLGTRPKVLYLGL